MEEYLLKFSNKNIQSFKSNPVQFYLLIHFLLFFFGKKILYTLFS
jgi:hypothetical protein